jgi:hypothetical protein
MCEENKVIQFDEEMDIDRSPNCCWRCESSDSSVEETDVDFDTVAVHFVCNDCSSTWEVRYDAITLFIATQ